MRRRGRDRIEEETGEGKGVIEGRRRRGKGREAWKRRRRGNNCEEVQREDV
jgi:hypothetical protein